MKLLSAQKYLKIRNIIEELRPKLTIPFASTQGVEFIVDDDKTVLSQGILGMYDSHTPDVIRVSSQIEDTPEYLISTVIHELRHMYQHQKMGWAYHIAAAVGLRELTIEPSAKALENQVDELMGLGGLRDGD